MDYMEPSEFFIGIDPSTVSTGYAVLDEEGGLVTSGAIHPPKEYSDARKLAYQHKEIQKIINFYGSSEMDDEGYTRNNFVRAIGIEDQFQGPNVMTLIKIARTASVCMTLAATFCNEVHMFYPASWRLLFHGTGKATKRDTIQLVNETHNLAFKGKDNDITDAIGIAHATRLKYLGGCERT
jgi:crossover junction endodeoxyribonuclease RuvC